MGWVKGSGPYGSGPNPAERLPAIVVYEGPVARGPAEVSGAPYGQEPDLRVQLPDRGTVDGLAVRWSRTHVLVHSEATYEVFNAWVPARWVKRITAEESSWRNPNRGAQGWISWDVPIFLRELRIKTQGASESRSLLHSR